MKLLFTTILLVAPKVLFALSEVEGSIRGAAIEPFDLDRELITSGSNSASLSFSVVKASSGSCYDAYAECLEEASTYTATSAYTDVSGNAFAVAYSEASLWAEATCYAYAEAHARACAFTRVDGDIKVDSTQNAGYKDVSISVTVKTATKTIAFAESEAVAEAYTAVEAQSFTDVEAYCTTVNNKSYLCAGEAGTELEIYATASSDSYGAAGSLATSGSVTKSDLQISGRGSKMDFINGLVSAYAKSWSYADAGALTTAVASTYIEVATESFAEVCVQGHEKICGKEENIGKGICNYDPTTACAQATASAEGYGEALAEACAAAYASAEAEASVHVSVSANVDCKSTPKLTWKCTGADAETECSTKKP